MKLASRRWSRGEGRGEYRSFWLLETGAVESSMMSGQQFLSGLEPCFHVADPCLSVSGAYAAPLVLYVAWWLGTGLSYQVEVFHNMITMQAVLRDE